MLSGLEITSGDTQNEYTQGEHHYAHIQQW